MSKNKEKYQENRTFLKQISNAVKELVKMGEYGTVNEAVIETVYKNANPEIKELNTFNQWKQKGFTILKGSKAFVIWGQPIGKKQTEDQEKDEYSFFPLCYLFANTQVMKGGSNGQIN